MREIVHIQCGQCGNQIGSKVSFNLITIYFVLIDFNYNQIKRLSDY